MTNLRYNDNVMSLPHTWPVVFANLPQINNKFKLVSPETFNYDQLTLN